jgi:hypothetical protein
LVGRRVQDRDQRLVVEPMAACADQEVAAQVVLRLAVLLAQLEDAGMAREERDAVLESFCPSACMTSAAML